MYLMRLILLILLWNLASTLLVLVKVAGLLAGWSWGLVTLPIYGPWVLVALFTAAWVLVGREPRPRNEYGR